MNIESNKSKWNFFVFIIVGEIIVGILLVNYLFLRVGILSEDVILINNREGMLGLIKLVNVVECIGVLIICLYFILCLCENNCRLLD